MSTPKTIVSKTRLLAELEAVRQQGYAIADEEASIGIRSLAAPIFDVDRSGRAAVSVNGSPAESAWDDLPGLIKLVEAAAREISITARVSERPADGPQAGR